MTPSIAELVARQIDSAREPARHADALALLGAALRPPESADGFPTFAPDLAARAYEGFSADEIAAMKRHQAESFYWISRNRTIAWLIERHFPGARRILDIGCGTGYVTRQIARTLPGAAIYASDAFVEGLRLASSDGPDAAFLMHLDATRLPFEGAFDLVCSFDVLEHIEEDEEVIARTHAALRPGGGVLHFVPQHPWLYGPADEKAKHVRRYARGELDAKLVRAGFDVAYSGSFLSLLFPLFAASRLKSKLTRSYALEGEHDQPAWLRRGLLFVQEAELAAVRAGARFPFGVSRVVVAFKR